MRRSQARLPPVAGIIDRVALGILHVALLAWVFAPRAPETGVVLLCGAAVNLWRFSRWRAVATRAEPLLLVLHVGYAWLIVGVTALGISIWDAAFPLSAHTLAVGAIGTMILAVMTRATRGHTGYKLSADWPTTLIYVLVVLATAARIIATFAARARLDWLLVAALLWIGAFGLFVLRYAPLLLRPRRP
jgi:uncharacterized protein involved in response to NO